ncbi:hypothetical protein CPT_Sansa61 [Caulobacter phage Sansa]|uniref:Uncharacterized protein n=1 Tax=Caulobacter phage Sansa TaxID=1675600 RepID=A0A0K1LMW3_9CAUD|nr:hypothetical protein HOR07_gp061 [Caulobacter phage Sansa]AKU43465.1 hypothetical protein CPT_Sansa61 [Caulobacter phage Sansa]
MSDIERAIDLAARALALKTGLQTSTIELDEDDLAAWDAWAAEGIVVFDPKLSGAGRAHKGILVVKGPKSQVVALDRYSQRWTQALWEGEA